MRYKTQEQVERRIEQLETKIARLEPIINAPQQTPGPFETGRSGYTMGRRLDQENERRAKAFEEYQQAKSDLQWLRGKLESFLSGNYHLDGRPKAVSPQRTKQAEAQVMFAEFMKARLKPGDRVALAMNPANSIPVKRVNKTSITDEVGERWKYDELTPMIEGRAMTGDELRQALREYFADGE